MGYYTEFELNVYAAEKDDQSGAFTKAYHLSPLVKIDLENEIEKMNVFESGDCDSGWYANTKWYDWEDDMALLSKRFPEIFFELHGIGEGFEDMWNAYVFNGAIQYCPAEITYPPFDPSKLVKKESGDGKPYSYQILA